MSKIVYLDNASTTKPLDEVIKYCSEVSSRYYGNPSSLHRMGLDAEKIIEKARGNIAETLNCLKKEIIFTSGGTESNNLAISGYLGANNRRGNHIITCKTEHPSILNIFRYLEHKGYIVDYISTVEDGTVDLEELKDKLRPETSLVSFMHVNNQTGAVNPLERIFDTVKGYNDQIMMHVDAVQSYGKLNIDLSKTRVDMMSLSAHKIHGPKGSGALYIKDPTKIDPVTLGGGQESNMRSGTENTAGIAGFGLAAEKICSNIKRNYEKADNLKKLFCDLINSINKKVRILSSNRSSAYILNISFDNIRGEVMLHHLAQRNIYISTGSACSSKKHEKNHVLQAMGYSDKIVNNSVRISFCRENEPDEIKYAVESINEIITNMERIMGKNV